MLKRLNKSVIYPLNKLWKRLDKTTSKISKFLNPIRFSLLIAGGAILWFVIWGDQGLYQREKMRYLKTKLERERIELKHEISQLLKEKSLLKNKAMLEMTIRRELGFIKPGEIIFELQSNNTGLKK